MEITTTTTIGFGKRWYHLHDQMIKWCLQNVGPGGWIESEEPEQAWLITCNFGNTKFYFANSEDALAFKFKFWEICI